MQITDPLKWNTYNVLESVKYKDQVAAGNDILSSRPVRLWKCLILEEEQK